MNTSYGQLTAREINRAARRASGLFALLSIGADVAGFLAGAAAWPLKKIVLLASPKKGGIPNNPTIDMDDRALTRRDIYNGRINELRARIEAVDPSINWRKITFKVNGSSGTIQITSADPAVEAKVNAVYASLAFMNRKAENR